MADNNVLKAQKYLNAMFGGHKDWVTLPENGATGTVTMQGIIRAFQIHNNVSSITGSVGLETISKMKAFDVIKKIAANDQSNINVCLIQCALFCKGYNAGGITGVYYTTGVSAVKAMQADAGLVVTGNIDWKVWMGLLSMNWFKLVSKGNQTVRAIQKQLNSEWSDIIGVGPCDGVVSRQTALSLIGALQAAEGVTTTLITNLNSVNFGNATTSHFPGGLKMDQNSEKYLPYNKLVQYGLYFNGYNPGRFDGIFDTATRTKVKEFQKFYALLGTGYVTEGEVNASTMKSLLTSKGDTNRPAKACDCSTILSKVQVDSLKAAGYTHVGRYLTGYVGTEHKPKYMTLEEISNITAAGLSVFPIYQDGGYRLDYFQNKSQGVNDAQMAILAAERLGIPENTTIYFAVDFDCYEYQMNLFIVPYFEHISLIFHSEKNVKKYKVGIYAPRYICTKISELGYAKYSFVADMSTGFSCNLGFPIPSNWAFDQFVEKKFTSSPSFDLDKDAYSGRDEGISVFDTVQTKSVEEIGEENKQAKLDIRRAQFAYDIFSQFGYLPRILGVGLTYDTEIPLVSYVSGNAQIDISTTISTHAQPVVDADFKMEVSVDNDGNLTTGCKNKISEITKEIKAIDMEKAVDMEMLLSNVALSMSSGYIEIKYKIVTPQVLEVAIVATSWDLSPEDPEVDDTMSVEIDMKISFHDDSMELFAVKAIAAVGATALMGYAVMILVEGGALAGVLAGAAGVATEIAEGIMAMLKAIKWMILAGA